VPELDMSSGTADEAADRALTAVARKLDRALSTEYTVNELIAEATDPVNLACMFMGESPRSALGVDFLQTAHPGWSPHQ
jgi:ataxia telangiectasia mutated family protein